MEPGRPRKKTGHDSNHIIEEPVHLNSARKHPMNTKNNFQSAIKRPRGTPREPRERQERQGFEGRLRTAPRILRNIEEIPNKTPKRQENAQCMCAFQKSKFGFVLFPQDWPEPCYWKCIKLFYQRLCYWMRRTRFERFNDGAYIIFGEIV